MARCKLFTAPPARSSRTHLSRPTAHPHCAPRPAADRAAGGRRWRRSRRSGGCRSRPPSEFVVQQYASLRPLDLGQRLPGGHEPDRQRIDTLARILLGQPFAHELVAQVAAAVGASDFRAPAVRIEQAPERARVAIVERRPAATGIELALRREQRGVAAPADVGPRLVEIVVFTREGALGARWTRIRSSSRVRRFQGIVSSRWCICGV